MNPTLYFQVFSKSGLEIGVISITPKELEANKQKLSLWDLVPTTKSYFVKPPYKVHVK